MKILVTGGTGFIGSHTVVELFRAGHLPVIIDTLENSNREVLQGLKNITGQDFPFYQADCAEASAVDRIFADHPDIQGLIHFAAYKAVGESVNEPLKYYRNNIGSMVNLLEQMNRYQIRNLVFSSSCTVYGQPEKLPVTEEAPVQAANSPYGNTKQICEEILRDTQAAPDYHVRAMSLRYFNPIGAHPSAEIGELPIGIPNNLVPFIVQTAAGIRDELKVFGDDYNTPDGTAIRDYIHVVDLAKAHVKAVEVLEQQNSEDHLDFVNLGTGQGNSVLEVIKAFEHATGEKLNYRIVGRRPGDVEQVYADVTKSKKVLGWQTEKTLEESLADAWRWQQKLMKKA